ncbi:Smr/MutS family protein [Pontibacter korlensis]|uniref:DNA mismatch repair protein MutS n=1 Tax=Pontibacter korlensis TaxID=400092 RepID=A0A0E3ZFM5_9BACT|nr:Smr/MutS family protein [Pontibacter korlensis]AKD04443.1 DNA mismatch repair protein MutS [Pontibacter korlensis]
MNVGDRVRLMSGREEGIITRILENNLIEVAIDNDFTIPVARREVVVIAAEEQKYMRQEDTLQPAKRKEPVAPVLAAQGIYLALVHQSEELLAVTVVNNSDYDVLFTSGEEREKNYRGLQNDKLAPKGTRVITHYHLKEFEKWPNLLIQFIQHRNGSPTIFEPVVKRVQFKASSFYKSKRTAPVLNKEAYLFQLDQKPASVNPDRIKEQLTEAVEKSENFKLTAPEHEVDLHIEKLVDDHTGMSNSAIIKIQLERFQDALDRAMATNMHEIVFIHGAGNGVLRKELQKILSRTPGIKYFEDARKEKFGYGATLVRLK